MWIGFDDTDSRKGMCTTYLTGDIIRGIWECGLDVLGYPRLVRLNPNIPWKTRGNGAVSLQVGKPAAPREKIGWIGQNVYTHHPVSSDIDQEKLGETLVSIIEEKAELDEPGTHPGLVITQRKPPYGIYTKTVQEIVTLKETEKILTKMGAWARPFKNGRGLIGATAAVAWRPYRDRTYELLTYGSTCMIPPERVIKMDQCCPLTFDNYDYENHHVQITPHSPGPVMYGIRGENTRELKKAMRMLRVSDVERWLLFESNQGTDDHLQRKKMCDLHPYQSGIVTGVVSRGPRVLPGGHLIFSLQGEGGIDCAAYEPTKGFRRIIREICPGDKITVYGGVREKPLTVNIEKIMIHDLVPLEKKVENPICSGCGRHMKSRGKMKGYKCRRCGETAGEDDARVERIRRHLHQGLYEVPVVARRHIAKPLKRMKQKITKRGGG